MPTKLFCWGDYVEYYDCLADGTKVRHEYQDGQERFYAGSLVYEKQANTIGLESAEFSSGRFVATTNGVEPRYFLTDHLGGVRLVVDCEGNVIEQDTYYPFGLRWSGSQIPITDNRYRFNGKEDQTFAGLPFSDYGARMYDPERGRWLTQDPLMEKYYSIGQYNYCMGNPVKYIDPNGEDVWELDNKGNIINYIETDEEVAFYMVKNVDGEWQRTGDKLEFGQGTKITQKTYTYASDDNTVRSYDVYQVRGDENGTTLFEFLADNITGSSSQVEMGQIMTGVEGDKGLNFITTSHTKNKEASIKYMINKQIQYGYTVREINHSHTANPAPSMNDIIVATQVIDAYKARGLHVPQFYIYHVPSRQKVSFGHQ